MPAVHRAWADLTNPKGELPYKHDHYLKLWQLSDPKIGAKFILFDEAQDANPVLRAIVEAQTHAQIVWVGDSQQQIYEFTGAVNALAEVNFDAKAFLTRSFRFGPAIADVANRVLAALNAELRISGTDSIPSTVGPVEEPDAILSRTNAAAVTALLTALGEGKRPHLIGGGKDVVFFAESAKALQTGGRASHPELACFETWTEVEQYVDEDQQGEDLRLMVKLINEFGADEIIAALKYMPKESDADVVISTAHKAKGREWDTVRLASDFPEQPKDDSELRLLYVAVTRAKLTVDITNVAYFDGGNGKVEPVEDAEVTEPVEATGIAPRTKGFTRAQVEQAERLAAARALAEELGLPRDDTVELIAQRLLDYRRVTQRTWDWRIDNAPLTDGEAF
jgi:ATP-dependent exoDNAse (exonuclease V) beta subunit